MMRSRGVVLRINMWRAISIENFFGDADELSCHDGVARPSLSRPTDHLRGRPDEERHHLPLGLHREPLRARRHLRRLQRISLESR